MNCLTKIADANNRDYITPEDVTDALGDNNADDVRRDLLQIIGKQLPYGVEDVGCCAFVAWRGEYDED